MNVQTITDRLGITLNDMQQSSVDAILNKHDNVVILSPTGSGKTYAYLLPLVQLIDSQSDDLQAVVLVPGRELAKQSEEVLVSLKSGIRGYACYGGRPTMDEHREMRTLKPHIIFATPGRINDHIDKDNISTEKVRFIVIDEFDKCLELGFREEMAEVLNRMPSSARRIFLSATDLEEDLSGFIRIDARSADASSDSRVTAYIVHSKDKDKLPELSNLLRVFGQEPTIVFLNYRESVERTAGYLRDNGFSVSEYHGGLDQKAREEAIYKFANGSANVLVSTNLGSRGLDIPTVENIVHYHLPETEEDYVHRVGRATRWLHKGNTFFILNENEALPDYVEGETVEFSMPDTLPAPALPKMKTLYIGRGKTNKISKGDIVGFLCKKGNLAASDIGRIDVYKYYSLAAVSYEKAQDVIVNVKNEKIKGLKTIVEEHH